MTTTSVGTAESFKRYREDIAVIERLFEEETIEVNAQIAKLHREAMVRREARIETARRNYAERNRIASCKGCDALRELNYSTDEIAQAHKDNKEHRE